MKKYTIEQIRKYLKSQDSFGDILYNLSEENIDKANEEEEDEDDFTEDEEEKLWRDDYFHTGLD